MGQKRTTLTKHLEAFRAEAEKILRHYLAWKRLTQFNDIKNMYRYQLVDMLVSLVCIENDLIIRICKFDDDTKGVHSFRKIEKELLPTFERKEDLKKKIEEFRNHIKTIKQIERNEKLAHFKIGESDNRYFPKYDLASAIKIILDVIDLLYGKKLIYNWSDGRDTKYEMRELTEIDKEHHS